MDECGAWDEEVVEYVVCVARGGVGGEGVSG